MPTLPGDNDKGEGQVDERYIYIHRVNDVGISWNFMEFQLNK
jgi:hypothetical protein